MDDSLLNNHQPSLKNVVAITPHDLYILPEQRNCLARVAVQNFQNQVSIKTASAKMDIWLSNLYQPARRFSSIAHNDYNPGKGGLCLIYQVTISPELHHKGRHNVQSLWNDERWHLTWYIEHHPRRTSTINMKNNKTEPTLLSMSMVIAADCWSLQMDIYSLVWLSNDLCFIATDWHKAPRKHQPQPDSANKESDDWWQGVRIQFLKTIRWILFLLSFIMPHCSASF